MNKHVMLPAIILALVACTPTPTLAPTSNIPTIVSIIPAPQDTLPATQVQLTEIAVTATEPIETLWLQILSPMDEAVVNTPRVDVIGSAPAGSVISINDEILIVDTDGQFKTTVALEEGPNLIEVLASDENGNETSSILTITYEP